MKKRKTPEQKKRESYMNDGRNAYGERGAHSRHSIRRRKRAPNRANRRIASTLLVAAKIAGDADVAEGVQATIEGTKPKRWQKLPDVPLGAWVGGRLRRRAALGIDDTDSVRARRERVRKGSK